MRSALRSVTPQPLQTIARRTLQAIAHIRHGYLVDPRGSGAPLIGMTSMDEQNFYKRCVFTVRHLNGAIVDLGCWMCSTTIPLVNGLLAGDDSAGKPLGKVYGFDRFIWEEWMNEFMGALACRYQEGESFLPEARGRLGELGRYVELIEADLTDY